MNTNRTANFTKGVLILAALIATILSGCSAGTSANQYDLMKLVDSEKLPASELDRITYSVRESIERNHRWDTEWLVYWTNAEAEKICGTLGVDNLQVGESDVPLEPVDLQDVVMLTVKIEYHGYTESQFFEDTETGPIAKVVDAKLIYKNESWEVKSSEELPDGSPIDNCAP